jgi:hypothetical protein
MKHQSLFKHQQESIKFLDKRLAVFDASDPGTGKTRVQVEDFAARRKKKGGCAMVIAPKSLLDSAWKNDFLKFAPSLRVVTCYAHNRTKALALDADVYVVNTDGVKDLLKQKPAFWRKFDTLIVDECFPAGTLVDTPNGPTPIEVLKCGDLVYTSSGTQPVTRTFVKDSNDLVQINLENGKKFICTKNHPLATVECGWMEAGAARGMSLVRLDIHKLNQQGANLLREKLQSQSHVVGKNSGRTPSNCGEMFKETSRQTELEQRNPLPPRNESQTQCETQSIRTQADTTGRQWANFTLRKNDARNVATVLGTTIRSPNWKKKWQWLSTSLQTGLRTTLQKMGFGNRREFTHIAKKLGCEEGFIAGTTRVACISNIKRTSPQLVYNLQVDGPHTYSVAGHLVHNCTTFKHHTSARSKAMRKLSKQFKYRRCMSGTPTSNGITDLWHQVFLLDGGERLGPTFTGFRNAACIPEQVGPQPNMVKWIDRPGVELTVATLLKDVMIRHRFEECVDIPANHRYSVPFELSAKHLKIYQEMEARSLLDVKGQTIDAVNGAVLYTKLLQIASGAVYDTAGKATLINTDRYELIMELVAARQHSIVFFNWGHQRDQLVELAKARGMAFALYDGSVNDAERRNIVDDYQAGKYQVLFAHPQSAGHGLTLTKGTATIWASPTYNLEHFLQGLKRIHRIGQSQKTETIVVIAQGTIDERVWEVCNTKDAKQADLLSLIKDLD